jgi:ribosomal protein S18 acetylase RimI-like enzyme
MIYREATTDDVPAMARIRAAEWGQDAYWRERIQGYMTGELHPRHALEPRIVVVAVDDTSAIVGFAAGHLTRRFDCDGELEWINVAPEHRGSGIADALLRALAAWFMGRNATRVCVDVAPENATARAFYHKHGAVNFKPSWMLWKDISPLSI